MKQRFQKKLERFEATQDLLTKRVDAAFERKQNNLTECQEFEELLKANS